MNTASLEAAATAAATKGAALRRMRTHRLIRKLHLWIGAWARSRRSCSASPASCRITAA